MSTITDYERLSIAANLLAPLMIYGSWTAEQKAETALASADALILKAGFKVVTPIESTDNMDSGLLLRPEL